MKTLLLFSKHIAMAENSPEIFDKHLYAAYLCLCQFAIDKELPLFQKLTELMVSLTINCDELVETYCNNVCHAELKAAEKAEIIPFSAKVSKILADLRPTAAPSDWINTFALFNIPTGKSEYRAKLAEFEQLKTTLLKIVYGQDHAVEHLIDSMATSLWHKNRDKPQGVFFFAGPPASGKTFLAEQFAKQLGSDYHYKLFDMTHYTNGNEAFGLVGAKKTYDDAAPGQLTQFVKKHPKSVIVFDEFEKAHTQVLMGLLRLLATGFLADEYTEREVDFRNTIIIFTSNLGRAVYTKKDFLKIIESRPDKARAALTEQLRKETKIERDKQVSAIPAELLSRLSQGSILLFKALGLAELMQVANRQIHEDLQTFSQISQLHFEILPAKLINLLVMSFAPFFDVRDIKANIAGKIIDPITDFMRQHPQTDITSVKLIFSATLNDFLQHTDLETLFQELHLRHEVLSFKLSCIQVGLELQLQFHVPARDMLLRVEDIEASGGIVVDIPNINFADIAGHAAVKTRLNETISIIKNRDKLTQAGIKMPKGMVLYGPPGTGKTTLARALASEAGLPMISCSGNDLLSGSMMQTVFGRMRKYAPCILFIDEIDALPKRGEAGPMADALINRLLTEIDGFCQETEPLFIIAATNRLHKLDAALLRSGRLDLQIEVPFLDKGARLWFIQRFLQNDCYDNTINPELIVGLTAGLSGADLEKIHRESVLRALSENNEKITQAALIEEVNILKYGAKRSIDSCERTLAETAYHEAGHAVISKVLMPERVIEQISVVPRAQSLGMVAYDSEQKVDHTKEFWFSRTCVALAGRAAQIKQFAEDGLDTGASSDLRSAMWSAWMAIAKYGMHSESYNMDVTALKEWTGDVYFKAQTEGLVKAWIDDATVTTDKLISENWCAIERVAQALLKHEVLSEQDFMTLLQ
ncbi:MULTISPECIES: AAA family ATPase [unclassified Arsukibacterium]|uniref:AAA family ATPase n=1 Tax=unclassified Arsukibacterium TaxID=2635278 RepID=UPI000C90AC04|nr:MULTISPECIES: AAA family ATPase [unclassified Arsukibacterium]MAA96173.1 hypothetical protein [Rheinheimera sp.]HAW91927.1 hypothetical protein [Candidatus Azambacteria bacterium]